MEVLEYDNVFQFRLEHDGVAQLPIAISGLCGRSMYSVADISVIKAGKSLNILIHIHLAKDGESGSFRVPLAIDDSINEISFGNRKFIVWTRPASSG